jgi:hypothetical protein
MQEKIIIDFEFRLFLLHFLIGPTSRLPADESAFVLLPRRLPPTLVRWRIGFAPLFLMGTRFADPAGEIGEMSYRMQIVMGIGFSV